MGEASTDTLRQLAPKWTLAGDDTLLTLLQNTHQKIVSKCQEVNTKLEEMVSSLDDASIHLQNVNNKFMSLSNRQFIESRVYDDDDDLTTDVQTNKDIPQPELPDEISMLKNSLAVLDSAHEITEIIDESDSDSDAEISVVLKAKDMYSHRPLPYIIGSQQWKSKWHAGLIIENSDSESIQSKENTDVEYSDSETDEHMDRHIDNTISESSSLHSDRVQEPNQHTPAQIAANIASVMAQSHPIIDRPITPPTTEYTPKKPPAIYKPTQPVPSTVFPDEPPPLDNYESDSSENDIFAEINKINKNKILTNNKNNVADDLFSDNRLYDERDRVQGGEELFDDYDEPVKQKATVIHRQLDSKSIEIEKPVVNEEDSITKKPIGGISLFGSNKNTDTIGAAILKRNLRRSSTSDESESEEVKTNTFKPKTESKVKTDKSNIKKPEVKQNIVVNKTENTDEIDNTTAPNKKIFEDLFSKKDKKQKEEKTMKKKEVNLFSDNIFDDVDDIFSSDVKIASKTIQQSLFDSDDDLFSDIAKPKTVKPSTSKDVPKKVETLFESDEELFSDLKSTQNNKVNEEKTTIMNDEQAVTGTESTNNRKVEPSESNSTKKDIEKQTDSNETKPTKIGNVLKAKSIFDSDSDDEIFNFSKPASQKNQTENSSTKYSKADDKTYKIPSLFGDDDDDDDNEVADLFSKIKNNNTVPINKNELNNEPLKQGNLDFISNTLPTKSQDEKIKTTQEKVVIKKETLRTNEEDTQFDVIEQKRVISSSIIEKGRANLNLKEESSKSDENLETMKPKHTDESANSKESLKPDETIFNESLVKDKQSLNEHLAKENENLIKENEKLFKENVTEEINYDNNLFNDHLFKNESNKQETLPEVPAFNENDKQLSDNSLETEENLFTKTLNNQSSIQNINDPEVEKDIPVFEDQNDMAKPSKDIFPPNKDIKSYIAESETPQASKAEIPVPLFDNILIEPPEFEKTKEPKKSKNVNALFDDDSEDEALFFKKNDIVSDIKPDIFGQTANFGLFADEPPAIDDFEKNSVFSKHDEKGSLITKNDENQSKSDDDLVNKRDAKKDQFNEIIESNDINQSKSAVLDNTGENTIKSSIPKSNLFQDSSDEEIFTETLPKLPKKSNLDKNKTKILETKSIFDDLDDNLFTNKSSNTDLINQHMPKKSEDLKKVGKINTQNININVQALMPGASPKKFKNTEPNSVEIEPKTAEATESKIDETAESKISENTKPTMVKSVSFEDSPDTDVLDNNASKKRAKIQVKRRPSSRKARHEAVRKSIVDTAKDIDIDKDILDTNKRDLDMHKRSTVIDKRDLDTTKTLLDKNESNLDLNETSLDTETTDKLEENKHVTKLEENTVKNDNYSKNNIIETNLINSENESLKNETKIQEKSTKIIYVLNDEDIFQSNVNNRDTLDSTKTESTQKVTTKISLFDDQSDEETSNQTKNEKSGTKTSLFDDQTKGEMSTQTKKSTKTKISLFDSDEEDDKSLFKSKPIVKKTKLFDSDSDDDLFSSTKTKNVKKEAVMKKSLFDDEDDETFGAKSDKIDKKPTSLSTKEPSKKTIFADPLSLFGDDD